MDHRKIFNNATMCQWMWQWLRYVFYVLQDVLREQKETLDLDFQDRLRNELEDQKCRCADEYEQEVIFFPRGWMWLFN